MPEFSIIIPVYNAERTLKRCLNSILNQTFADYEVILVDDGSTDDSNGIICQYCESDSRFHLKAQPNSGPGSARNAGLSVASGRRIAFVDCDDYVGADYLASLYDAFDKTNADMVFFGYHMISSDGKTLDTRLPNRGSSRSGGGNDYYKTLLRLREADMFGYTWIKAFDKRAIGETRFYEDISLFKDALFICDVFLNNTPSGNANASGHGSMCNAHPVIAILDKTLYYYAAADGSLMGRTHQDYCNMRQRVYSAWENLLLGWDGRDAALEELAKQSAKNCCYYGFERRVNTRRFFTQLSQCSFFSRANPQAYIGRCIRDGKINRLRLMKLACRVKIILVKLFGFGSRVKTAVPETGEK